MPFPRATRSLLGWGIAFSLLLAGCTDQLVSPSPPEPTASASSPSTTDSSKVLYRSLMDLPDSSDAASKSLLGLTPPRLIVEFRDDSYTPYKFFRRYKYFRRYNFDVVELNESVPGVALIPDEELVDWTWWMELLAFLSEAEEDAGIAWVTPDLELASDLPSLLPLDYDGEHEPWGVKRIGAIAPAHAHDVEVYVMDTGVQSPDLSLQGHVDVTDAGPGDTDGHGTHVAGTVAATDNNTGVRGVAPDARVVNVNVFGDDERAHSSDLIVALDSIIARKQANPAQPMVVNLSLGANVGTTAYGPLDRAVEQAIASGIVVVVAAGNERIDAATVTPAHVHDAITVGAYDPFDLFAGFSNYGSTLDLLAPGVEIPSLLPSEDGTVRTGQMSGTSAAAPHVAGAAARYLAVHPTATPQQVRDALVAHSRSTVSGVPSNTTNRSVWVEDLSSQTESNNEETDED